MVTTKERINKAVFLLKLKKNEKYMERLGVIDVSKFKNKVVSK